MGERRLWGDPTVGCTCTHLADPEAPCCWRKGRTTRDFQGAASSPQPAPDGHPPLQAFSEYQMQQMTANFADQFGFKDEDFADQDDGIR